MKRKTSAVATLDIYLTYKSIDRKRDTWLEWRNSSLFLWSSSRDCEISKMRFNLEKSPVWTRELSNAISGARARSNIIVFIYEDTSVICLNLSWKYLCVEIKYKKVCSDFYYSGHVDFILSAFYLSKMVPGQLFSLIGWLLLKIEVKCCLIKLKFWCWIEIFVYFYLQEIKLLLPIIKTFIIFTLVTTTKYKMECYSYEELTMTYNESELISLLIVSGHFL